MIGNDEQGTRHVIPRWLSIKRAVDTGELTSGLPNQKRNRDEDFHRLSVEAMEASFERKKAKWLRGRDPNDAEEFIATALLMLRFDDSQVIAAATALSEGDQTQDSVRGFAEKVLSSGCGEFGIELPVQEAEIRRQLGDRRRTIQINPRDSLLLAESALLYANLGQLESSWKLLRRAIALTPNDRYVLRAASRFFVHTRDPEYAIALLQDVRRTQRDPWLLSALLATQSQADAKIVHWKLAKQLLGDDAFSQRDRSELGAEIGTHELAGGSRLKALRTFKQSIADPTENAVAQVESVGRRSKALGSSDFIVDLSQSFEATTMSAFHAVDWSKAFLSCGSWQSIEPFSSRPAVFGTFMAALNSSYVEEGLKIGLQGHLANKNDRTLLNNLSVVYAYNDDIGRAEHFADLASASSGQSAESKVVSEATRGLIAFRKGDLNAGASKYMAAIQSASNLNRPTLGLRAYAFFALEMARFDHRLANQMVKKIHDGITDLEKAKISVGHDIRILSKKVEEMTPRDNNPVDVDPVDIAINVGDESWSVSIVE